MTTRRLSRQEFLALGAAVGGTSVLAACDLSTQPSSSGSGSKGQSGSSSEKNSREAPALAAMVKDGKLPPVEKRLPVKPRVLTEVEQVGRYGGTWHTGIASSDPGWLYMTMRYDQRLVGWDPKWKELRPIAAEAYEIEQEGRAFTFTLREGMKWSDGEPFTADDLVFWRDAVVANKKLTPVPGPQYSDDGKPFQLEKHDDYHFTISFKNPHGLFLQELAWFWIAYDVLIPKHYLQQFHKDYNPDADELAKQANVRDWTELFLQKRDRFNNPDLPVLTPWRPTSAFSRGGRMRWERNPYYWSVDTKGSQLPYLDEVQFSLFNDPQPLLLSIAHGDVDYYQRTEVTTPQNKPVLARSAQTGGYQLRDIKTSDLNTIGICLNLTNKDLKKRQVYQNKDFRIGLSHAINRQQIIDTVYQRQGRPWQTAPRPEVPFYDSDDMGTQYTEFDLKLANEHLDKSGFTQRNGSGIRLGPDGKPITVSILTPTRYKQMIDAMQLIKPNWEKVGVELHIDAVDPSLVGDRIEANEFDCTVDFGQLGYLDMIRDPRWLFSSSGNSMYAPLWVNWYNGVTPKEEPPAAMRKQMQIYRDEVFGAARLEDMFPAMRKLIEIARDEFWSMGVSLPDGYYNVVKEDFHNVPKYMWLAFMFPGCTNVAQYFTTAG